MERLIHIHAKCDSFEIFEQLPEEKSFKRLEAIKKMFLYGGEFVQFGRKKTFFPKGNLVVNTILVNPEFPFKYN